jgi:hypothetical protein
MDVGEKTYRLARYVCYDEYDNLGLLLDIKHDVLEELEARDAHILRVVLECATCAEAIQTLSLQLGSDHLDRDVAVLLDRLENHQFLEQYAESLSGCDSSLIDMGNGRMPSVQTITRRQRIAAARHIIFVLHELSQEHVGLYKAYLYIHKLSTIMPLLSPGMQLQVVRDEYWLYRLVTGLFERRIAKLLGQVSGEEGLCMIRAFALCAYLLILGVPAQIVIARPTYGSRSGFKLHVWVELRGKPLNETPNIRDRHRILSVFPPRPSRCGLDIL